MSLQTFHQHNNVFTARIKISFCRYPMFWWYICHNQQTQVLRSQSFILRLKSVLVRLYSLPRGGEVLHNTVSKQ